MTDAPKDDVVDFLRERFGRLDAAIAEVRTEQREQRGRLAAIERLLVHIERESFELRADMGGRLDRVLDRLDRIERRADLVE